LKENTGAVHAQVPVDVASFLLNEKRAEIQKLEARLRVNIVLVPNSHLDTPHYKVQRLRHDELNAMEHVPASYELVEAPEEPQALPGMGEPRRERQEAVVKAITPEQPAPIVPEATREERRERGPEQRPARAEPPASAPQVEAAKPGLFGRILGWLGGGAPATPAAPAAAPVRPEARPPQRDRERRPEHRPGGERREHREPRREQRGQPQRPEQRGMAPQREPQRPGGERRPEPQRPPRPGQPAPQGERPRPEQRAGQPRPPEREGEGERRGRRHRRDRHREERAGQQPAGEAPVAPTHTVTSAPATPAYVESAPGPVPVPAAAVPPAEVVASPAPVPAPAPLPVREIAAEIVAAPPEKPAPQPTPEPVDVKEDLSKAGLVMIETARDKVAVAVPEPEPVQLGRPRREKPQLRTDEELVQIETRK
jgi:ribonuclease E